MEGASDASAGSKIFVGGLDRSVDEGAHLVSLLVRSRILLPAL